MLCFQKVDTYSLGIMFFEMCHAPLSTKMEWYKILVEIRKPEISFPPTFDPDEPQAKVVRLLLDHNPHRRPSATELLQNSLLPPKMEDEELQEVSSINGVWTIGGILSPTASVLLCLYLLLFTSYNVLTVRDAYIMLALF